MEQGLEIFNWQALSLLRFSPSTPTTTHHPPTLSQF